jgi:hypothetical protein
MRNSTCVTSLLIRSVDECVFLSTEIRVHGYCRDFLSRSLEGLFVDI